MIKRRHSLYLFLIFLPIFSFAQNTWAIQQIGANYNGIFMASATEGWAVGEYCSILHTNDSWATSDLQNSSLTTSTTLNAVWGTSSTNVWVVAGNSIALNYNGSSWSSKTTGLPSGLTLTAIWGTDANNVFVAGSNGTAGVVYQYNGTQWTQIGADIPSFNANAIWGSSATDLWVAGTAGQIYHYVSSNWISSITIPSSPPTFQSIWGTDANNIWAVGTGTRGSIYYWNGTNWTAQTTSLPNLSIPINSIWGTNSNNIWAVTGSSGSNCYVLRFNGTAWSTVVTQPSPSSSVNFEGISGTDATTMSIAGGSGSLVYTFNGTSVALKNNFPNTYLGDMWAADANNIWAVGSLTANAGNASAGMILKYDGTSWQTQSSGVTTGLNGIWGTDANNIWAVGGSVSGNATILKYNGTSWSSQAPSPAINISLNDIWGSSANDIWAIGSDGNFIHSTNGGASWSLYASSPAASASISLSKISGVDANHIWAVGVGPSNSVGKVYKYNGATWTEVYSATSLPLNAVWAADANNVWAVGNFGYIYRSTNGGTSWVQQTIPSGIGAPAFYGIYGIDRFNVWAIGLKLIKWNGLSWSTQTLPSSANVNPRSMTQVVSPVPLNPNAILSTTNLFMTGATGVILLSTDNQIVLPVELLSFTAKPQGSSNRLTWATASEINNKGFQIERLKATGNSWDILGFKTANPKAGDYDFVDNAPLSTSYYRLRQIDNDGQETRSKVVSVSNKDNNKLKAYPNPVSNSLTIETDAFNKNEIFDFQIINLLGQQVQSGKMVNNIDVSKLLKGTYVLKIGNTQIKFNKE